MLDLKDVPANVVQLAVAAMIDGISVQAMMREESAEANAAFAARCGLDFDRYISGMRWLSTYLESHSPLGLPPN